LLFTSPIDLCNKSGIRGILYNVFGDTKGLFVLFHSSSDGSVDRTRENARKGSKVCKITSRVFLLEREKGLVSIFEDEESVLDRGNDAI